MDRAYADWREGEIKRIGLSEQLKAEAFLDKHDARNTVEVCNEKSGSVETYKADVASVLLGRKECSTRKIYSIPGVSKRG